MNEPTEMAMPLIFPGTISVCINTSNEGPRLKRTIDDFRANLAGNQVEFVVVADGVTDGCCDDLGDDVRVLHQAVPRGCGRAKTLAASVATGDVLFFCDAHHQVTRGWLARLAVEAARTPCIVCPVGQDIEYDEQWIPHLKHTDVIIPNTKGYLLRNQLYARVRYPCCTLKPVDAVYCFTAMSRQTLEALGGWNKFHGRHGWQEYGISLRALGANIPIKLAGCVWVGHEWRQKFPYDTPRYRDNRRNLWHMFRVIFSDQAFREHVEPYVSQQHAADMGRDVIDAPDVLAERDYYLEHCRKRTDEELLEACEIVKNIHLTTHIPYLPHKRLGDAYNHICLAAKEDEWILLLDHDVLILCPQWYEACVRAITIHGASAGVFTARTNRIGCPHQRAPKCPSGDDIATHAAYAKDLFEREKWKVSKLPKDHLISGFFMLTSRSVWERVGGFMPGFLGVDNDYHKRVLAAGLNAYRLDGVYCYHRKQTTGKGTAMT